MKYNGPITDPEEIRHFLTLPKKTLEFRWIPLGSSLTDIEYLYKDLHMKSENEIDKPQFVTVGAAGGLGVCVLAISIFWGLKGTRSGAIPVFIAGRIRKKGS